MKRFRREPQDGRGRPAKQDNEALESLALSLAAGILHGLPFLLPALSWLHFVALVPWLILLTDGRRRKTWLYFLVGNYLSYAMAFGPFSPLHKVVPFWCGLVVAPWMLLFAVVMRTVYRRYRWPLALLAPAAWVAAEWVRLRFSVGQVGLFPLASSQYRLTDLIQIADLTGMAGISFLVAAVSGAVADLWLGRRTLRRALVPAGAVIVLLAAALAYGGLRSAGLGPLRQGPAIALVQPNEVHYRDPGQTRALFDRQIELAQREIASGSADLIALPENTIDYPYSEDPYYVGGLRRLAQDKRAAVLAGAFAWASRSEGTLYTSGLYLSPDGDSVQQYDKLYLIPWAEYLPFARWLPGWLNRRHAGLVQWALGYEPRGVGGERLRTFDLASGDGTFRLAAPICYEVASPFFARRAVASGAEILVNISSEGFFGAPLYHQMWALSTLRAVENRIAVVRVGNNGISGFIDPIGRTQSVVRGRETGRPYLEPGTLVDRARLLPAAGSFYSRYGDWFAALCLAFALGSTALAARRRSSA